MEFMASQSSALREMTGALVTSISGKAALPPKELRPIAVHGHKFEWASIMHPELAPFAKQAVISGAAQASLAPTSMYMYEVASASAKSSLLQGLAKLSVPVPTLDLAEAVAHILEKLVAVAAPVEIKADGSRTAAKMLTHGLRAMREAKGTTPAMAELFRRIEQVIQTTYPGGASSPAPILIKIVQEAAPVKAKGQQEDHRDYLSRAYQFQGLDSLPSSVLMRACSLAAVMYGSEEQGAQSQELFAMWVRRACTDPVLARLLDPIMTKLQDVSFDSLDCAAWERQLRVLEAEGNSLHPLVQHLTKGGASVPGPPAETRQRALRAHGIDGQQPLVPTQPGPPRPTALAAGQAAFTFKTDPAALAIAPHKMGAEWVTRYGVVGRPAPNSRAELRPWLHATEIAKACGLPLPRDFTDEPQIAGDACPFHAEYARVLGLTFQWHLHKNDPARKPSDPPMPAGPEHQLFHQVLRCAMGLAFVHMLNRQATDAGLPPSTYAHFFESRPAPTRG
jgi:hypothetical protein